VFLLNWHPSVKVSLDISRFSHESGFAYWGPAPTFGWIYGFNNDDSEHPAQSNLVLLEDGQPLGPAHTIHDAVRRTGGGGYSHWGSTWRDHIIFSTSDNSNPLSNRRRYMASGTASLRPFWRLLITSALLAILMANLITHPKITALFAARKSENDNSPFQYRRDIEGLRAVAVTLIILFHLGLRWIPGGYIGVDVFFVISGYLITGIISRRIEANTFTFVEFYQRRIKRIFPALFVMVAATLAGGFFLVLPGDYATIAKSAIYAALASSNFFFLLNTGYFDAAAEMMPLLHTWSLGVEEQFYLVWPSLIVGVVSFFGRKWRPSLTALLVVAFLSYFFGTVLLTSDPKAAFYLPFTRAWEFVAGALLSRAVFGKLHFAFPLLSKLSGGMGLALVIGSAFLITQDTPFPSWFVMVPVAGAALIVAPFNSRCLARRILSSLPLAFIGRISYSLYLWHWPIITLYRHYNLGRPLNLIEVFWLSGLIVVVSLLSWRYVEEPFRQALWPARTTIARGFAAAFGLAATSLVIISYSGFPQRVPADARLYESLKVMLEWKCPQEKEVIQFGGRKKVCVLGTNWELAKKHGILIGDSHASHMAPLLDVAARAAGIALLEPNFSCMPLIGTTSLKRYFPEMPNYTKMCTDEYAPIVNYVREHDDIQIIVLAAAWSSYAGVLYRHINDERSPEIGNKLMREGIKELTSSLGRGHSKQFLIISEVPAREPIDVGCLARSSMLLRPSCPDVMFITGPAWWRHQLATDSMIRALPADMSNVSVSIPHDHLCRSDACVTVLNNEFLYSDAGHLRRNLTTETTSKLSQVLHLKDGIDGAVAALQSGS
jgi:peptidoglycan/LPS O-acetylase OafA/YrhL